MNFNLCFRRDYWTPCFYVKDTQSFPVAGEERNTHTYPGCHICAVLGTA